MRVLLKVIRPFFFGGGGIFGRRAASLTRTQQKRNQVFVCVCVCLHVCSKGAGCVYPHHAGEGMRCKSLMCVYSVLASRLLLTAACKMRNYSRLHQTTGVREKQNTDLDGSPLSKKTPTKTRHTHADDGIALFQPL